MAQPITYQFEDEAAPVTGNGITYQFEDAPPAPSAPSFMGGVGDALSQRGSNIAAIFSDVGSQYNRGETEGVLESATKAGGRLFRTAGQVAGGVNDIVGEGLKAGYRNLMPEGAQQAISGFGNDLLQSRPVQAAAPLMQAIQEKYGQAKEAYPSGFGNIEATANIAGLVPTGWAGRKGAGILKGAVTPMQTFDTIETAIDKAIVNGVKKGIKPTVAGKSDAGLVRSYYDKAKMAVRDIVDSTTTPISKAEKPLEAFSQAVKDTKIKLHQKYNQMATAAGEKGAMVDLQPVINDMQSVYINANVKRAGGGMPEMLKSKIDEWGSLATKVDPAEAEELIAMLNQQAKPYWKDPTSHTTAAGLERIAQQTRKQTFDAIEAYEGPGYAELRKRYGAQLALEKEVTDRATVAGRRADFGFFDLANIPVAAEFVSALSGNPASMAKAGAMWGTKKIMQRMNDPEHIIRKMFKDVETLNAIKKRYQ